MEHLVQCFNPHCKAAFTMMVWIRQDYTCPTCKMQIGDFDTTDRETREDTMVYVECEICGRWKPSMDPPTEYCCGHLMRVTAEA